MNLKILLLSFIIVISHVMIVNGFTSPPFIEFKPGTITLTESGKKELDSLGSTYKKDGKYFAMLESGSLVLSISAYQSKEQLEELTCLSLKRYRKVVKIFMSEYGLDKSYFQSSLDGYVVYNTEDINKQGLNVIGVKNPKIDKNDIQLPYDNLRFNDSDINEKLNEIGREIRCEYEFYEKHPILITPHFSKEEYEEDPCIGFERYMKLKEFLKINFNLDDIRFRYEDVKYGYEGEEESSGFNFKVLE